MFNLFFLSCAALGTINAAVSFLALRLYARKRQEALGALDADLEKLNNETEALRAENRIVASTLEQTVTLYDLTKDICSSLQEDVIFSSFKETLNRYAGIAHCSFVKNEAELAGYEGEEYTVMPVKIDYRHVGHLVARGVAPELRETFRILAHQFMLGIKRAVLYARVQEMAITDSLTATYTRRYFADRFSTEIARAAKFKYPVSVLMLDVDHFKRYNDQYGHLVGDFLLKEVAAIVKENVRQIDSVIRYGGEEFLLILPETEKEGARFAAERIRQAVESKKIRAYDEALEVTVSIGLATFPADAQDPEDLVEKSDRALYRAKQGGRNSVCVHGLYR